MKLPHKIDHYRRTISKDAAGGMTPSYSLFAEAIPCFYQQTSASVGTDTKKRLPVTVATVYLTNKTAYEGVLYGDRLTYEGKNYCVDNKVNAIDFVYRLELKEE